MKSLLMAGVPAREHDAGDEALAGRARAGRCIELGNCVNCAILYSARGLIDARNGRREIEIVRERFVDQRVQYRVAERRPPAFERRIAAVAGGRSSTGGAVGVVVQPARPAASDDGSRTIYARSSPRLTIGGWPGVCGK